jgi:AraC-like DNA-binding protein
LAHVPDAGILDRSAETGHKSSVDALSDVLAAVRLSSGAFLDAEFTAPWCISARVGPEDCRPFGGMPAHVAAYHYVLEGRLHVELEGLAPLPLAAGDMVLLPRNDPHRLASEPGMAPVVADELIELPAAGAMARLRLGGGGERTRLICGFLGCEVPDNPLAATLPPLLRLSASQGRNGAWLAETFRVAAREYAESRFGSATILNKLAELLFVEAVRRYAESLPPERTGWLAGLRDPVVGRALALLHGRTGERWTTQRLAREVGLSRSALAERFTRLIGEPPISYLARWRMQVAAQRLRETGRSTGQIAWEVGYESDAAFHRAFKRVHGVTPSAWRSRGAAY